MPGIQVRRVALYGGTFDPIHEGHLHVVRSVLQAASWESLWMLPVVEPPHRVLPLFDAETRYRYCKAATDSMPLVHVSRVEYALPLPSYSIQTLRYLHEIEPHVRFVWVIGADAWQGLTHWREWKELFNLTDWLVVERPGFHCVPTDSMLLDKWNKGQRLEEGWRSEKENGQVYTLEITPHPASSTEIRKAIKQRNLDKVQSWIPEVFWDEIVGVEVTGC